eukprot:m.308536 g.308536  ORF g.308536 m.308536 type:complete len:688 (+) comp44173_c0_seq1:231-2294(+)
MVRKRSTKEAMSQASASAAVEERHAEEVRRASKSPSPDTDDVRSDSDKPRAEKKKSWLKKLFGKGSKRKSSSSSSMKRSMSEPSAVVGVVSDSSTDRELSPDLASVREDPEDHTSSVARGMAHQISAPSLMPSFRKRPVTVHVDDDVWAQVKAKQDVMFEDSNLLKVDETGAAISSRTPPVKRQSFEEQSMKMPHKFDVTDEEWQKVKAAQEKMFSKSDDSKPEAAKQTDKPLLSPLAPPELNKLATKVKQQPASPLPLVSSAAQVRAALAKKEEEEKAKQKMAAETLAAQRLSSTQEEKEEEKDDDLEHHDFFASSDVAATAVDEVFGGIEEHEFFASSDTVETPEKKESPTKFNDLVRRQSLKLHESREARRQKRHTIASPEFISDDKLWGEVLSKHGPLLEEANQLEKERLDDKEVDITPLSEDFPSEVKVRKSGVMVGRRRSEPPRPSIIPQREGEETDGPRVDSGYLSADLTAIPQLQPSLGLSAGYMKRNVSRKHKRRPPSIRLASLSPTEEGGDLFDAALATESAATSRSDGEDEATEKKHDFKRSATMAVSSKARVMPPVSAPANSQPPSWLQELQKKKVSKTEGAGSSATLPYRKGHGGPGKSDGSTAAMVAMAAKKRISKESLVSFNTPTQSQEKPKPKSMVIHETTQLKVSSKGSAAAPEWITMAKRMTSKREQPS